QLPNLNFGQNLFRRDLQTGTTIQVTKSADGLSSSDGSIYFPAISADGRFVTFSSTSTNLVSGYTIGHADSIYGDVYLVDIQTGIAKLVSVNIAGTGAANADVTNPSVSNDGSVVAFQSGASNLVAGDMTNADMFVHNMLTGVTSLISSTPGSTDNATFKGMSGDGRYVLFLSDATTLDPLVHDANNEPDLFVTDRQTGKTALVSVDTTAVNAADIGASD